MTHKTHNTIISTPNSTDFTTCYTRSHGSGGLVAVDIRVIYLHPKCRRKWSLHVQKYLYRCMGRDTSVSTPTVCGFNDAGIEAWWGRDFPHPSSPAPGPTQPPILWVPDLFPGDKTARALRLSPPQSDAEVKERVKLYHYSPSVLRGWLLGELYPLLLHSHQYFLEELRYKKKNFM